MSVCLHPNLLLNPSRRRLLQAGLAAPLIGPTGTWGQEPSPDPAALLKAGGLVLAMRHALAPGTFDPPQFKLGDCSTQRLLSEEGREQARRIGAWFNDRQLKPGRVRSSPWCRCLDTATLAFGSAQAWSALGSPRGASETTNARSLGELRQAIKAASGQNGRFEVWVTHMFVLTALTQQNTASGEALLLRNAGTAPGQVEVLARFLIS